MTSGAPDLDPRRWSALAVCVSALFITLLDVSIVNVALPSIGRSIGADASELQWVVSGYALAFGMVPIIGGRLGDDRGRKRMLMIGIAAFVVFSAMVGFAPTPGVIIAGRVLQGLTLAPLIRALGVASTGNTRLDVRRLQRTVTQAALEELRAADDVPDDVREAVVRQYENRLGYRKRVLDLVDGDPGGDGAARQLRDLLARATEAERDAVLQARRRGDVSIAAADAVLFDVEARALRYES